MKYVSLFDILVSCDREVLGHTHPHPLLCLSGDGVGTQSLARLSQIPLHFLEDLSCGMGAGKVRLDSTGVADDFALVSVVGEEFGGLGEKFESAVYFTQQE